MANLRTIESAISIAQAEGDIKSDTAATAAMGILTTKGHLASEPKGPGDYTYTIMTGDDGALRAKSVGGTYAGTVEEVEAME